MFLGTTIKTQSAHIQKIIKNVYNETYYIHDNQIRYDKRNCQSNNSSCL